MRTGRTSWTGRDESDNIKTKVLTLSETISSIFFYMRRRGLNLLYARREQSAVFHFSRGTSLATVADPKSVKWMRLKTLSCHIIRFHKRRTAFTGWCVACVLSSSARAPLRSLLWQNDNRLFCFRLPFLVFESLACPDDDSETHFILHCTTWNMNTIANGNVWSDHTTSWNSSICSSFHSVCYSIFLLHI